MSPLTLVTGGPGSGKTETLVTRLAERYESDPFFEAVVLVPTVRHGDQFRRRLVSRCGVAFRIRVETIAQFSRGLAPDAPVPSFGSVEELLALTASREIDRGGARYFGPIAGTEGFHSLLSASVTELLSEAIDPQALSRATELSESPSLTALSALFRAFVSELEQRAWLHPVQVPRTAAEAVKAGAAFPDTVMVDGFQVFRGIEFALLEALAERSDVVVGFDPHAGVRSMHDHEEIARRFPSADIIELRIDEAGNGTVVAGVASDREAQLRAIARQIKQRLTDDPSLRPSDCAITFRQVSPYLSMARQVFAEYDLPLDPAAGERLSNRPLGVWLRRLLRLAKDGWRLRDLVAVLSSAFVDLGPWQLSPSDVPRVAREGREAHLWAGEDAFERIVEGLRADAVVTTTPEWLREALRGASDGLAAALTDLRSLLDPPPKPVAEHARSLGEALFGSRALIRPGAREIPGVDVELDALRGYLSDLASLGDVDSAEPTTFDAFVARLERELDAPAVLLREAGGVLLAPMHTMHGLRFDFVAVGGLTEGEFPAPRTSTSLLSTEARKALNEAGLPLPPEPRFAEDELWASVLTRADRGLALWRARLNERGRPASASYYFDSVPPSEVIEDRSTPPEGTASRRELVIACSRQWPEHGRLRPEGSAAWPIVRASAEVEQLRRSFRHAGEYEGVLAAGLVPRLTGEDAVWSASRLESYRTCSFQFFGKYGLRLRELDEEMDGADAATRGSVIHSILQDALGPLVLAGRPLTPDTVGEAVDRLRANGPGIWERAPSEMGFGRAALWRLDAEPTFQQIESLLRREAEASLEAGVTSVVGAEHRLDTSLPLDPPLHVMTTADRVDEGDGFVVVVDYKSGREIPRAQVLDGRRVQLQLYGYLAREAAGAERVIARYAWLNPRIRQWDLDSSRAEDQEVIDDVVAVAAEVRRGVESGDFRVNPQVQPCPTYCAYRHVCRVNEFSRWKHWD